MTQNALVQKLSSRGVGRSPIPDVELIGETFARLLEERLRPVLKTIISALIMDCEIVKLSGVLEGIPVPAMLGIAEVDGSENQALINVASDLVYHIVDMRMGGDSSQAPLPTARSFTGVDEVLCGEVFGQIIGAFRDATEAMLGAKGLDLMRHSDTKQNATMVRIAADSADVLRINVSLDIGEAARSGDFDLILPLSVLDAFRARAAETAAKEEADAPKDLWRKRMTEAATLAELPLTAVLHRTRRSLAELGRLKPGDVIPIPARAKDEVRLVHDAGKDHETVMAAGRLGTLEDEKVVKLTVPPDEALQHTLAELLRPPS